MKSEKTKVTGNGFWHMPIEWIQSYQKRGKFFLGVKIQESYKHYEDRLVTFRLTRIFK